MRMRIRWFLLIAGLLLTPTLGFAQSGVPPAAIPPAFLSNSRPESGGMYAGMNMLYMRASRPMPESQQIAIRGFRDFDGAITGKPGQFVGNAQEALNTDQLRGPGNWQPGWDVWVGWKFEGGIAVEFHWRHLVQAKYSAAAHILPPDFDTGGGFESTFLFSPVTNFPTDWAGNAQNIPAGTPGTTFGIWNGASIMQIDFVQRYDTYGINVRIPINETENTRTYGLFGPRIVWIWDRFHWRTVDQDINGDGGPETTANYTNMISNRMYGAHAGFGNDFFLGTTPIGGFAFELDLEAGLYLNLTKTRVAYAREDGAISSRRARRFALLTPSLELKTAVKWYVYEGITLELGYDIQTYFNTLASPRPVDFNLSSVDPQFDQMFFRWYHGMRIGINFSF